MYHALRTESRDVLLASDSADSAGYVPVYRIESGSWQQTSSHTKKWVIERARLHYADKPSVAQVLADYAKKDGQRVPDGEVVPQPASPRRKLELVIDLDARTFKLTSPNMDASGTTFFVNQPESIIELLALLTVPPEMGGM